jgi:radical SAM superfamily enzyme YgiQ (UPF0313 family)
MFGLPYEDYDDLDALVDIAMKIANLNVKGKVNITLSISPFIPKPHTPFQWEAMEPIESLERKKAYLKENLKDYRIKLDVHNLYMSKLEGILSRGDRNLGNVIEKAFLRGARFDNWGDLFRIDIWDRAFLECGISPHVYLRRREYNEPLPWAHIDPGVKKEILAKENIKAHRIFYQS